MVTGLERFTRVKVIENGAWYYVESVETGDQVDIAFDDPRVARRYALSQRLVLVEGGVGDLGTALITGDFTHLRRNLCGQPF